MYTIEVANRRAVKEIDSSVSLTEVLEKGKAAYGKYVKDDVMKKNAFKKRADQESL